MDVRLAAAAIAGVAADAFAEELLDLWFELMARG